MRIPAIALALLAAALSASARLTKSTKPASAAAAPGPAYLAARDRMAPQPPAAFSPRHPVAPDMRADVRKRQDNNGGDDGTSVPILGSLPAISRECAFLVSSRRSGRIGSRGARALCWAVPPSRVCVWWCSADLFWVCDDSRCASSAIVGCGGRKECVNDGSVDRL